MVQLSHPYMTTEKTIPLTIRTFVDKVVSLLFNRLSGFVIDFLPRSKRLLISWWQSLSAVILEPKKIKFVTASTFPPSICNETKGLVAMIKPFFHSPLSPSSRGSSVPLHFLLLEWVSSVYLRLFMFLPAILIPACDSSSLAFCMMYSAYKLNKQGDNITP